MSYRHEPGGRFTATNCSLDLLIQYGYQVLRYQISGAPEWVTSERYDIAARSEGNPPVSEMPALVQGLLEDRFQLKSHWETKDAPVFHLVVSKAGRLRESTPAECAQPGDSPCGSLMNLPGETAGRGLTATDLAGNLSFFVQASVADRTNLTGRYDVELKWAPESQRMQSAGVEPAGPSIFTALQEQLGLKLESARGPVRMLVIDHVARPSEN
jgi:uncharacterized protein (TIGR03435 family)